MIVDNYYRNIFGEPMRKKREDHKKKKDPELKKKSERAREESGKKEKDGSKRTPSKDSNSDHFEVKTEIDEEIEEFDLKREEIKATIPGHMNEKVIPGKWEWEECEMDFMKNVKLKMHISTHSEPKKIVPPVCSKKISNKRSLTEHKKMRVDTKVYLQSDNEKVIESKIRRESADVLQDKVVDDDTIKASKVAVPEESFSLQANSTEERKEIADDEVVHENQEEEKAKDEKEKSDDKVEELTEHDSKVFENKPTLHRDEKIHKSEQRGKDQNEKSKLIDNMSKHTEEKLFDCGKCGKFYAKRSGLMTHKTKHEIEDGTISSEKLKKIEKKKIYCEQCGKLFYNQSQHVRHVKGHKGIKDFQCDQCEKSYTSNTSLAEHIEVIHLGKRSFVCSGCGQTFGRRASLKIHFLNHSKELPL